MTWNDQTCYEGDWFRGIQHGYGKLIYPDGTSKEGYFENNIYIGKVKKEPENLNSISSNKMFSIGSKLNLSKSSPKLGLVNLQDKERNRIKNAIK
mmetsp:Transcript_12165/g.12169  ORF Transcript_12165/g.12169 Transcript_12165/m.12169 type:complete len:95 (-) Transcript_12165:186-470(-)